MPARVTIVLGLAVDRDGDVAARVRAAEHLGDDADERGAAGDDERGDDEPAPQPQRAPVVRDRRPVGPQLRVRLGDRQRLERRARRAPVRLGRPAAGRERPAPARRRRGAERARSGAARGRGSGAAPARRPARLGGHDGDRSTGRPASAEPAWSRRSGSTPVRKGCSCSAVRQKSASSSASSRSRSTAALLDLEQLELAREVERGELRGEVDRQPRVRLGRLLAGRRRLHRAQRVAARARTSTLVSRA